MESESFARLSQERDRLLAEGLLVQAKYKSAEILSLFGRRADLLVQQGIAFSKMDFHLDASRYFIEAQESDGMSHVTNWYLGLCYMHAGDYRGWSSHHKLAIKSCNQSNEQFWDGETPCDKIVVIAPGGIGDVIFNLRFAELLRPFAKNIYLSAPERIIPLIQNNRIYDDYVPIEKLGSVELDSSSRLIKHELLAGIASAEQLSSGCYRQLTAPIALRDYWLQAWRKCSDMSSKRVGICWQGKTHSIHHQGRSIDIEDLAPLTAIADMSLVSLQHGVDEAALMNSALAPKVTRLQSSLNQSQDFLNLAAQITCLDLVVSCDTGIAHLSAALGIKTIIVAKEFPSAFWNDEKHSTLYPSSVVVKRYFRESWHSTMTRAVTIANRLLANTQ